MYEIGKVYIWQNQVGAMACLNGEECTVLTQVLPLPADVFSGKPGFGQMTDSTWRHFGVIYRAFAEKGDLRLKEPPSGEKSILSLFTNPTPVLETA